MSSFTLRELVLKNFLGNLPVIFFTLGVFSYLDADGDGSWNGANQQWRVGHHITLCNSDMFRLGGLTVEADSRFQPVHA
jgi:hypothetical protein